MRRFPAVLAILLLLAALPAPAATQDRTIVLSGTVTDAEGRPLAGATVRARGPVERAATTDRSGRYRIGPIPAARYELGVEALGYEGSPRSVRPEDAAAAVDFVVILAPLALEPIEVVAAVRGGKEPTSLPIKIDVIEEREVRLQRSLAANPAEMLSNLIPSFSPARQKLTSAGESFRGRRPLFLIDGVPQSNPLRDGRRDGFTIGMEAVERVEVVFGANALQGLGATGGIVNYVTLGPARSGALEQRVAFSTTSNDGLERDGLGWRGHYLAAKRFGSFDVLGSVGVERRGLHFDGRDRAIAIDNVQGDVADSDSRNVFAKVGWEPDESQRLQLMASDFRLEQNGRFDSFEGDRTLGIPAGSVKGGGEGLAPVNDVTTLALDYRHEAVLGGTLSAKTYLQDFSALFGGGRFGTFQDPAIAPEGELFDQSENNSRKVGTRLTWSGERLADTRLDAVAGFDFLHDETYQGLVHTDRKWVPVTRFFNYAPFAQLDLELVEGLSLSGGLRWEIAELDVPSFTTLAGNRSDFQPVRVAGGSPGFDEPLFNIGGVLEPLEGLRIYSTFAQAFTMPDVGRVLRGIAVEGTAVADFLDLTPVETDNFEIGSTYSTARARVGVTYFESDSEFGSRLVPNADGIYQVRREPTRTRGWELTGRVDPSSLFSATAGYSMLEGRFDGDRDGTLESDLGAADIGPDRLNLSLDVTPAGPFRGRLQAFRYFDRDFLDGDGAVTARFDGYTTADASLATSVGASTVTISVANLLDEQFITYYGQAASTRNDRYFAGRGRTLTLSVESRF